MATVSNMLQKALKLGFTAMLVQLLAMGSAFGVSLPARFSLSTTVNGRKQCLSASETRAADLRDGGSMYVSMRQKCDDRIIFSAEPYGGGALLKAISVPRRFRRRALNWYLSVHDFYPQDQYSPDSVRVIIHNDRSKAAVWDLQALLTFETTSLRIVDNLDIHWDSRGLTWYMSDGAIRTQDSFYVAIAPNVGRVDTSVPITIDAE